MELGLEYQKKGLQQLSLAKLLPDLQKNFPDWNISAKELKQNLQKMTKQGIIAELEKLPTGFFMVHFYPVELTQDPIKILTYGREKGMVLREDLITHFEWNEYRVDKALKFLISRKDVFYYN